MHRIVNYKKKNKNKKILKKKYLFHNNIGPSDDVFALGHNDNNPMNHFKST